MCVCVCDVTFVVCLFMDFCTATYDIKVAELKEQLQETESASVEKDTQISQLTEIITEKDHLQQKLTEIITEKTQLDGECCVWLCPRIKQ